jgi:general secretion pathway protein B
MSLILEALKKAERQHKLGEVPGLGAQPVNSAPIGLRGLGWLMLILFAFVMLGLGLYLGGFRLTEQEGNERAAPMPEVVQPPVSSWQAPETVTPVPVSNSAAPTAVPRSLAPAAAESGTQVETPPAMPVTEPPSPPSPPPPPARPLSEMPSGYVSNLPSLNIDIHSYDQLPAKRYVLINMEKYHEGDYLAEGPLLIEIQTDGAVLEHLGERFILPIGNQ